MATEDSNVFSQSCAADLVEQTSTEIATPSPCSGSKFVKVEDYVRWAHLRFDREHFEFEPPNGLEVETDDYVRAQCRVITGIGARMDPGSLTTLRVAYRLLDSTTGLLGPLKHMTGGVEPHQDLEVSIDPAEAENDSQVVLCGFGARAAGGNPSANITTLSVWTRDILPDGTLASPEEHRYGTQKYPPNGLEVLVMVPNPGVIVGIGMRADPGNITHVKAWFGHLKLCNH